MGVQHDPWAFFIKDESGATAIVYGLIADIVGVGIIVTLRNVSGGLRNTFNAVNTRLSTASE
ncbi:MAG: Flp family type IVb pilin [Proteobacteria bacterium]|nr:Flp family type IVb pilin [Pseudomonadota bacterium]